METDRISAWATRIVLNLLFEQGRTQEWLSDETGIPMRTLSRRLHKINPSPMSIDELSLVAAALGTSIIEVLAEAKQLRGRKAAA